MVIVNTSRNAFSERSILFTPGVPSYAPPDIRPRLLNHPILKPWDGVGGMSGDPIFVALPPRYPQLCIAAIGLLRKLLRVYPTLEIQLNGPDWLKPFLPPRVRMIAGRPRVSFYRQLNLIQQPRFNPIVMRVTEWQQLVMMVAGYYDDPEPGSTQSPDVGQHWNNLYAGSPERDIALIPGGFHAEATQAGIADKLESLLSRDYSVKRVEFGPESGVGPTLIELAKSRFVVACGDSNTAYSAVSLGVQSLVFVRSAETGAVTYSNPNMPEGRKGGYRIEGFHFDNVRQYAPFSNVAGAPIDPKADAEELAAQVTRFVGNNLEVTPQSGRAEKPRRGRSVKESAADVARAADITRDSFNALNAAISAEEPKREAEVRDLAETVAGFAAPEGIAEVVAEIQTLGEDPDE